MPTVAKLDFVAIARAATLQIKDDSFREYLLRHQDEVITMVVQYMQQMDTDNLTFSTSCPYMMTLRRVTDNYCSEKGLAWLDFLNSETFLQASIAMSYHFGETHMDNYIERARSKSTT